MPIITVASTKGGPGKTMVSQLLVGGATNAGLTVAAVDADPGGALYRWIANTYEGPPITWFYNEPDETRLAHLIHEVRRRAELVVVDTAGFGNKAANVAMAAADLVLIPMCPGEADATEAVRTTRIVVKVVEQSRRNIQTRLVLNRTRPTKLARHAMEQVADLPRLGTEISDLTAYGEMTFDGRVPTKGKAAVEIKALLGELAAMGLLATGNNTQGA